MTRDRLISMKPKASSRHTEQHLPVIAAIAVRKKFVSTGYFSLSFYLQSLQLLLFVRLYQKLLYELIALKIRKKSDKKLS